MNSSTRLLAIPFALSLILGACGSDAETDSGTVAEVTEPATEPATESANEAADESAATFNTADVTFAQNMIPHHEQAVEMATMALNSASGAGADVTGLAERIKAAQGPEIELLTAWLIAWGEPLAPEGPEGAEGDDMEGMDHSSMDSMAGMMSADDMAALGKVNGAEFDKQWMTMMTQHHQGAIDMSTAVQQDGSDPAVKELAGKIIEAQTAEIAEMQGLLAG